jgi:hypothetical protein
MRRLLAGCFVLGFSSVAFAQADVIAGLDVEMHSIRNPRALGREGSYPTGMNGIAFETTVCNIGSVGVKWRGPMLEKHPFISLLIGCEANGRFVQISDRSYIKHTFAASNASDCATCSDNSDSSVLAIGCSDTYDTGSNGDRYWLGPPGELDPWLGNWVSACSYLDHGDPPVAPPDDCDSKRSLDFSQIAAFDNVKNRCQVSDADLGTANANFFMSGAYLIRGEAEANRSDSYATREFVPSWNGSSWDLTLSGGQLHGSILREWSGSTLRSATNGDDDGRVFIASLVTGPDANGIYHYEYAVHNRDNSRGISSFRLPVLPGANITNVGFRDIDADATNDWTLTTRTTEIEWSTTNDPLEWNTIYNFWFDADVAPADGMRALVAEFRAGAGFDHFDISTTSPSGPAIGTRLGFGMAGGDGVFPDLALSGGLDVGGTVQLVTRYAAPSSFALAFLGTDSTGLDYRGGKIVPFPPAWLYATATDAEGLLQCTDVGVGGSFDLFMQIAVVDASAPNGIELTEAVEIVH